MTLARTPPRLHFVTFGGGSLRWRLAARRLAAQCRNSGWFASVEAITDQDLPSVAPELVRRHGVFMSTHARGMGYWIWRPPLLRSVIERRLHDGIVVFLDAGCELNVNPQSTRRLVEYTEAAEDYGFLAMRTTFTLAQWTKADLVHASKNEDRQHGTCLIEPGVMLMTCTPENAERMATWEEWCEVEEYHLLDDSPSVRPNDPAFIEHRHDQSVLTCLDAKLGLYTIPRESYFPGAWQTDGATYPFWASRNRWPIRRESGNYLQRLASHAHARVTGKEDIRTFGPPP